MSLSAFIVHINMKIYKKNMFIAIIMKNKSTTVMASIFLGMLLSHFSKDVEKESFGSAGLFMTLWHFF